MLLLSGPRSLRQGGEDSAKDKVWKLLTSKPAKIICGALVATVVLAWLWFRVSWDNLPDTISSITSTSPISNTTSALDAPKGRLHLLIPATSSGPDLCKLLLSAQVLGYPTPVLINYGDHEDADPYKQHITKVKGILDYLHQVNHDDSYEQDLVLIIDGYDIWFQLRPDVLIKRFYAINAAANARAVKRYGQYLVDEYDIRQTVIFGPDKLCWPVDFARPACWAVPEASLPENAFGPRIPGAEDREKNEARWLNSGTIMGTVEDTVDIFQATLDEITSNYVTDSDQYYFANIFGDQEFARISRKPELMDHMSHIELYDGEDDQHGELVRMARNLSDGIRTEYHIGLDYDSSMFQTLAYWKQHLAWLRPVDSWSPPNGSINGIDLRDFPFPEDIEHSIPPFMPFEDDITTKAYPSWPEVQLLYNILTKEFPVLLHVTGNPSEKTFRYLWWQKLWFQAEGEKLRQANLKLDQRVISPEPINGIYWFNSDDGAADEIEAVGKGGAWTDRRGWLSWGRLCDADVEADIFHAPGEELYHPIWRPPPEDEEKDAK